MKARWAWGGLIGLRVRRGASFDKVRMRVFLRATKISPQPEPVEGRGMRLRRCSVCRWAWGGLTGLRVGVGGRPGQAGEGAQVLAVAGGGGAEVDDLGGAGAALRAIPVGTIRGAVIEAIVAEAATGNRRTASPPTQRLAASRRPPRRRSPQPSPASAGSASLPRRPDCRRSRQTDPSEHYAWPVTLAAPAGPVKAQRRNAARSGMPTPRLRSLRGLGRSRMCPKCATLCI